MTAVDNAFIAYAGRVLGLAGGEENDVTVTAITKGGSDRRFYRLSLPDGRSFLFMAYGRRQEENAYWAGIADFLEKLGIPAPAVYGHDEERGFVLMEDLGDRDLWSYRHESWEIRRALYRRVLKRIRPLYVRPLFAGRDAMAARGDIPIAERTMKGYDAELYRWEQDYFLEQFVRDVCDIRLGEGAERALRGELALLTERLLGTGTALVHRDLQSQNIMICRGEPYFIDFQGLRPGSLFYDLGSLLYDSYVPFTEGEREELVQYAWELMAADGGPPAVKREMQGEMEKETAMLPPGMSRSSFGAGFLDGSVQRLMQALGAFGFLGLKKGKEAFLGHIPRGVENLCGAAGASGRVPGLSALARRCRERIAR